MGCLLVKVIELNDIKKSYDKKTVLNGISLSEAIKRAFFEKIEDEYDIAIAEAALKEYEKNPKTYTLAELMRELDL